MSLQACLESDYCAVAMQQGIGHIVALERLASTTAQSQGDTSWPQLLDLEGLGAEIWEGIDAVQYLSELRDEWDTP